MYLGICQHSSRSILNRWEYTLLLLSDLNHADEQDVDLRQVFALCY